MLKSFQSSGGGGGGNGTVTNIATAGPITGGPITSTGTLNIAASGVTPNTYGNATTVPVITIDVYGRVTSASNVTISSVGGTNGTVTSVGTDANLTGGPITTTGNIGLAPNISFNSGNVTVTNSSVGTAIVNINTLNAAVNGLNAQIPVNYASTANLSVTYNNGTSGVGATLTATASGVLTLDGATPILAQRVLIKDQTAQLQNGVYTVTAPGTLVTPFILTRATDYDQSSEIAAGDGFYVISGSTQNNTTWVQQTPAPVTVGTTALVFTQFAGTPATSILPISRGGTGANTASQALSNLGGIGIGKAIAAAIVFGGG